MTSSPPSENTFCSTLPTQPRIWDPTRLGLLTCKRKHELQTVRGLRKTGEASVHLMWGSAYHACTEHFDELILRGTPREEAVEDTIGRALEISWDMESEAPHWVERTAMLRCTDPAEREHKRKPGVMVQNRERCRLATHPISEELAGSTCRYDRFGRWFCECGLPMEQFVHDQPLHPKKTRITLLRAVALYCDTADEIQPYCFPDGTPAVEIQFRIPLPINSPDPCPALDAHAQAKEPCPVCHGSGYLPYELLVNIDSLVIWPAKDPEVPCFRERKTTGQAKLTPKFWRQYEMNMQVDTYDLVMDTLFAGTVPLYGMVEVTRVGTKDAQISRLPLYTTAERRLEHLQEICEKILDAEQRARGDRYGPAWPRNIGHCHSAFGTCAFWDVCTASASEREDMLSQNFHREPWDPISCSTIVDVENEDA